jgi:hypothetical protein
MMAFILDWSVLGAWIGRILAQAVADFQFLRFQCIAEVISGFWNQTVGHFGRYGIDRYAQTRCAPTGQVTKVVNETNNQTSK